MSDTSPTDPAPDELRRLLRTDELGVDPAQRERAIRAALAAADAPDAVSSTAPDGPVLIPFARRQDHRRLRVVATAAAVLVVFVGVATVLVNPLSQNSGQDSSSETAAELSSGSADAADPADESLSTTTAPGTASAGSESAESTARAAAEFDGVVGGLVDLGEFDDEQALIDSAPPLSAPDVAAAPPAVDPASTCGVSLASTGSVPVATARLDGVAVLVARSGGGGSDGGVVVLSSADCSLLASG